MILTLREARMLRELMERGLAANRPPLARSERLVARRVHGKVEDEVTELEARDRLSEAELELRTALDDLWLRAGEPSTRQMARQITSPVKSHMTWHYALRCNPVPPLATLRALVLYLEGDLPEFERLWLRAKGKDSST